MLEGPLLPGARPDRSRHDADRGLLTALVVAREWERGTFEALFVTPVQLIEALVGKMIPYFVLGLLGLALSVIGSLLLFGVPLRGSLLVLTDVGRRLP